LTVSSLLLLCLMAATLPALVRRLLPPIPEQRPVGPGRAVVVLSGGAWQRDGDWQPSTASRRRLLVAIDEARRRGLPLLISGGSVKTGAPAEAELMAQLARRLAPDLDLILETASRNTWENAAATARILAVRGIREIILVTDRPHISRAMLCFQVSGIQAWPLPSSSLPEPAWAPSTGALSMLPEIWYEWLALFWYDIRYFQGRRLP
jgi:uncharacterized SAM-binding protein YcdF (DUF218 family)